MQQIDNPEQTHVVELLYVIKGMQKLYRECYTHRGHSKHNAGIDRVAYSGYLKQLLAIMWECDVDKEFDELKKILENK